MFKSMRAIILLFAAGLVILTTSALTFFAQHEVTDSVFKTEFKHAQDIIDYTLLNISTEYQSLLFFRGAAIELRKKELKDIVDISQGIVELNYKKYREGKLSESEAKRNSLQQLKDIRYDNGIGYIWVNDTSTPIPRMIMHPTMPELDGKILDSDKFNCAQGTSKNLFVAFRDVCEARGSGYVDYLWPKPTDKGLGKEQPKLSYVSLFKDWGWIIGSGVYLDDINKDVDKRFAAILDELRESLSAIKIGTSGYVFVFSGKNEVLIHPVYRDIDVNKLINPETSGLLLEELKKAASENGVHEYIWDKPPGHIGEYKFRKRAYIKYFKPFDWYVCSSVYKDELQQPGLMLRTKIILLSLGVLALALIFAAILSSSIVHPLLKLIAGARAIREGGVSAVEIPVEGTTETKELGTVINQMLDSIRSGIAEKEKLMQALEQGNRELTAINYQLEVEASDHAKARQELLRLRNHQKNILDSMPSILVGVDAGGAINQWNAGAAKATGRSFEKVSGMMLKDVFPELAAELEQSRPVIAEGNIKEKVRVPRKIDGEVHYEDITIYPLINEGLQGAVIRLDDVTARVRIEEVMVQTEKMMSVGGLAAGMAHEINNPLGGILQGAQNIERRLSPGLKKNIQEAERVGTSLETIHGYMQARGIFKMLEGIREAATRAADIITNMLNFSRKTDVHRTSCMLDQLADKAVALAAQDYDLKKKYDFKQIEIIKEYGKNIPYVICSPTEIEQVFLNLLGNAAQAMHDAEQKNTNPKITIRVRQEDDYVVTEVEDNGPGMDDAIRRRVFEPFFTTKPKGTGTGLGMSVSYFIITENHQGSFSIESTPGKGSKFIFRLPITTRIY
ncbi:cache domain-containing protein [Maridesulfovibrio sp.]|uniref:cache domain-containing protein n=1 Tax=Maridesulfovibrio sp. TaxID=2795000 RepID=UPI002A18B2EA|nr:cache domain-containing protein [Maridesulfovibrio sp.]